MGPVVSSRLFIALLVVAAAGACDGKVEGKGGEGQGKDVPQMTAAEFYKDYSSLKGADRLNKYGDGVAINGQVIKSVYLGQDEGLQLWLGVDGPGHIAARFEDGGAGGAQEEGQGRRQRRAALSVQRQAGRHPVPRQLRAAVSPRRAATPPPA